MPVVFKDFGKGAKDILSKKFDYQNELKTVHKADGNMTLEAGGVSSCKGGFDGSAKFTYKNKDWGEVEKEWKTQGSVNDKIKLTNLFDGATVTVTGNQNYDFKVETDYKVDAFTLQFDVNSKLKSNIQASADVIDGLVAGVKAELDFSNGADLKDWNFGLQYGYSKDLTLACVTSSGRSKLGISALQKICCDSVAVNLDMDTSSFDSSLCVGYEKKVDKTTTLKCKVGTCGALHTALEYKLADPQVKLNLAAQYDATNLGAGAKKFGLGVVFGDY